ncbi:hypothetical protein B566_EDAN004921 [Ephemera danica]|nr:hypothetical protein B566_EDAN004921 [Ephemera danica]
MGDPDEEEQETVDVEAAPETEATETEDEAATEKDVEKKRRPSKWKETARGIPWATVATTLTLVLIVVALYLAITRLVESTASPL